MQALRSEILLYQGREKEFRKRDEENRKKIQSLQAAIRALTNGQPDVNMVVDEDENEDEGRDEDPSALPVPTYDEAEDVFRCTSCFWEVIEGLCQVCGAEHAFVEGDEDIDTSRSVVTDHDALNPDRQLAPRGTTPVLDVKPWMRQSAPEGYAYYVTCEASETYLALITRGATRKMCVRYHLEFKPEHGIVAWADSEIYETYAGPDMRKGDFWKIYLGRRVDLEAEDVDGSEFMNDLLEEALLYPLSFDDRKGWKTCEESPGIWATRPVDPRQRDIVYAEDEDEDESEDEIEESDSALSWSATYARAENIDNVLNRGPVRRYEDYDHADDNASDISEGDEPLMDCIQANVPDTGFDSSDDGMDEDLETKAKAEQSVKLERDNNPSEPLDDAEESSADSDFDSQEELSGDEAIVASGRLYYERHGWGAPSAGASSTAVGSIPVVKEESY